MRKRKDRKEAKQETWERRELEADILRERESESERRDRCDGKEQKMPERQRSTEKERQRE